MPQLDAGQQYLRYRTTLLEQREIVRDAINNKHSVSDKDAEDLIAMLGLDEEIGHEIA